MRVEMLYIIVGMAIITYFTRIGSLVIFNRTGISDKLVKWLKHVPTSMLTALIIPSLLLPQGKLDITLDNHYLLAGAVAALVAYKYKNVVITMGVGLAVMLSLRFLAI